MKMRRSEAAFSLTELVVAAAISCIVGLVIYGVASEALFAFARNISINRSYSDARRSMDRIGAALQTAGYAPKFVDATGTDLAAAPPTGTGAAGIRFYQYGVKPRLNIPQSSTTVLNAPVLTGKTITISRVLPTDNIPGSPSPGTSGMPAVGDLITISVLGFQGVVSGVSTDGTILTFANALYTYTASKSTTLPTTVAPPIACVDWTPVAFIVVGQQVRYYSTFISGTTSVNDATKYKVVTNLITPTTAIPAAMVLQPFSQGPAASINVDIYAEAPDYNNRNLGTANTYTYLQSAFCPRNPSVLQSPY